MELDHTPRFKECIEQSKVICRQLKGTTVQGMDLFLATLISNHDLVLSFITNHTTDGATFIKSAYVYTQNIQRKKRTRIAWSRDASKIIKQATIEAEATNAPFIGVEHLFTSCIANSASVQDFFSAIEVNHEAFYQEFIKFCKTSLTLEPHMGPSAPPLETSYIDKYCDHINTRIMRKDFQFYGRMDEVNAAMTALCRKQKSNVVFVGEAGVGKTALVEGLALAMEHPPEDSDIAYVKMDIFELKLSDMLAGAMYRGEFEKRLTGTMEEIIALPSKVVLFIDEFHMIVGAGDRDGAMDAANILKPALANGQISCIGATTFAEYKKYIEKDAALARRFEVIHVKEPTKEETTDILIHCKQNFENFHNVSFTDNAIRLLVDMADEHIPYRRFPDKAFDLLDEAGTYFKLKHCRKPNRLNYLEKYLRGYVKERDNSEDAEKKLDEYQRRMLEWTDSLKTTLKIYKQQALEFVKQKFRLSDKVVDLQAEISKTLVGQDKPLAAFCTFIRMMEHTKRKNKPKFSLLLAGAEGTGKSTLIAQYCKLQPLGIDSFEIFDMTHYSDGTSLNKLIGSSAGYVGYDRGGVLTELLKNNPNVILFLRNIEKAHPTVVDLIGEMLKDGFIKDNIGQKIDCSRCSIFLTTNQIQNDSAGFVNLPTISLDRKKIPANILSGVDKTIVFEPLGFSDRCEIVERYIQSCPLNFKLDASVVEFVVNKESSNLSILPALSAAEEYVIGPAFDYLVKKKYSTGTKIFAKMLDKSVNISILDS